jgi:hypothetical protein
MSSLDTKLNGGTLGSGNPQCRRCCMWRDLLKQVAALVSMGNKIESGRFDDSECSVEGNEYGILPSLSRRGASIPPAVPCRQFSGGRQLVHCRFHKGILLVNRLFASCVTREGYVCGK